MSSPFKDIEKQAQALGPEDRAKLTESLLASLRGPSMAGLDEAWSREVNQRLAAYDAGETRAYPAEEVFAEARQRSR